MLGILEKISSSELVSNGYISNHNKVRRPRPKFKVSFYLYFCCFWINVTQINFENIKRKIQIIISDSCFHLKSWFIVDARAPSIPLLNFPFKFVSIFPSSSLFFLLSFFILSIFFRSFLSFFRHSFIISFLLSFFLSFIISSFFLSFFFLSFLLSFFLSFILSSFFLSFFFLSFLLSFFLSFFLPFFPSFAPSFFNICPFTFVAFNRLFNRIHLIWQIILCIL